MKVLFFTPALPLPPFSGGQVRSLNLLKQLSKEFEVTLFSFIRSPKELEYLPEIQKIVKEVKTFNRRSVNSPKNFKNMTSFPFAAALYYDPQIAAQLNDEIKVGYHIAHFESFYTFPYLSTQRGFKTIAGNENVEYMIYQRYAETKSEPIRTILRIDAARMRKFEEEKWRQADVTVAVSESDRKIMSQVVGSDIAVVPNGIDPQKFGHIKRRPEEFLFLFVGPTKYIQNADAAKYLVNEIWPEVKKLLPNSKLWFVGRDQQEWLLKLKDPDIEVQTDLQEITEAYERAAILIAPLRAGSGTKFKILEAFAAGVPVLTTKVGIEGIDAVEGESYLGAQDPPEFAQKAKLLLENSSLNAKIVHRARKLVQDQYSWDKIGKNLRELYHRTAVQDNQ